MRLTTPVNEDVMAEMGWNGMMDSDEVYATAGYMDPNNFSSHVCVKVRLFFMRSTYIYNIYTHSYFV